MKKGDLVFPLREKYVAMLAPSFIVDFDYPKIILQLRDLGFDKVVELTFGAKMINRDYHKLLKKSKNFFISSVCPGIVETIKLNYPEYRKNLIPVDSPMVAMAKICKKTYPSHKIVFVSPCEFKKTEAKKSKSIDNVITYQELVNILKANKLYNKKYRKTKVLFDKFYNDFTKVYPLAGGLYETAHLRNVLDEEEALVIDGIKKVVEVLGKTSSKVRFLDVSFCVGGCIGGPCINSKLSLNKRRKKVLDYLKMAKTEDIPELKKGLIRKAKGISFVKKF